MKNRHFQGFTLVEIMIAIAIISIVFAIAIPQFISARKTAQGKTCCENLQQIDGAKERWAVEMQKNSTSTPAWSDLYNNNSSADYLRRIPICPGAGTYTLNPVSVDPTCSVTGSTNGWHALP